MESACKARGMAGGADSSICDVLGGSFSSDERLELCSGMPFEIVVGFRIATNQPIRKPRQIRSRKRSVIRTF